MTESLAWITPYLPEDKPRHLLGIGTVKDIFIAVEAGMDTMDCVIPTREARHGKIYTATGPIDIRKGIYAASKARLDAHCGCPACTNGTTRAYLRTLFA
jgi:queuine tRNA-ribosyltransferase